MLTKQDLNSIRVIVKDEIKTELIPVRKDIKKLRKDLTSTINYFDNSNDQVKSAIIKTRKDLNLSELEFA